MSHNVRRERRRVGMHRRTNLNWSVETLEGRILLSGAAEPAGVTGPGAIQVQSDQYKTTTSLQSSTKSTASGNKVVLTATVHLAGRWSTRDRRPRPILCDLDDPRGDRVRRT